MLGIFDLDPCACPKPRPWATAREHIALPEDGLNAEWEGRIWMNPPYSNVDAWMCKMSEHSGMALLFARTETETWQKWVWPFAHGVLFIAGRLYFCFPDGSEAPGNAGGPSALVAYSGEDAEILYHSGIAGAYVNVRRYMCGSRIREIAEQALPLSDAAIEWMGWGRGPIAAEEVNGPDAVDEASRAGTPDNTSSGIERLAKSGGQ